MRNLKKFLALALAVMMVMSLMITADAARYEDNNDISLDYAEAVEVLSQLGVVKGQEDGSNFAPKAPITRAEAAVMVYRIAANDPDGDKMGLFAGYSEFEDVTADWYDGAVSYCNDAGIIQGDGEGHFYPMTNVKGYEVLAMALRMLGYGVNGEFQGTGWQVRTLSYARQVELIKNISATTLSANASREVVAEILFQALQADLVDYNLMQNYHARKTLLENNDTTREAYEDAIEDGRLELPLNLDLMYDNYGIVGKSPNLTFDAYGRPSVAWVTDDAGDKTTCSDHGGSTHGDAEKYIPNADLEDDDAIALSMAVTPVAVYYDAITECQLAKDVTGDKAVDWKVIAETLNGNGEDGVMEDSSSSALATDATLAPKATDFNNTGANHADGQKLDALHTSTDYIGATGRTTEIYAIKDFGFKNSSNDVQEYVFVYYDTFLGKVTKVTPAIKDSAGHTIKKATATVEIGNNAGAALVELELTTDKYESGELILVTTCGGGQTTAITGIQKVSSPEKAPLKPEDVPSAATQFQTAGKATVYAKEAGKPTVERVTVKATVGAQDDKMGVIGADGKTYMASNTFLAARADGGNKTVLAEWYDIPVPTKGITNNMIGRTFDLALDKNGYIVGMDEVLTIDSSVGVITGVDSKRIATGKYLSEVEAYMTDGVTRTFCVPRLETATGANDELENSVAEGSTTRYKFFSSSTDADVAWVGADDFDESTGTGMYGEKIGIGSLVKFAQVSVDGATYWKIDDYDAKSDADSPADLTVTVATDLGKVYVSEDDDKAVSAGVTDTLKGDVKAPMLDDRSVVFVTEYDYRYNTGGANEGGNVNMTYKVYEGFKTLPAIECSTGEIVYQRLDKNPEYFLIGKDDDCNDYIIKNQPRITVDETYLLLSRGATFAEYSEYNVLKNGEKTVLQVANGNDAVNAAIENTLTGVADTENQLIMVTGRNSKGYVTSIIDTHTIQSAGTADQQALLKSNGMLKPGGTAGTITDYTVQIAPDGESGKLAETANGVRAYGSSVLQINAGVITDSAVKNGFLTIADGCKALLVNRDLNEVYPISLNEAVRYANGVDKGATADGTLASRGVVFEKDENGYVCALYVIDDWTETAS